MLSQNVQHETITIHMRRGHVLEDALRSVRRRGFPFTHTVKVSMRTYESELMMDYIDCTCMIYVYVYHL